MVEMLPPCPMEPLAVLTETEKSKGEDIANVSNALWVLPSAAEPVPVIVKV